MLGRGACAPTHTHTEIRILEQRRKTENRMASLQKSNRPNFRVTHQTTPEK